jgi:hypothetical protein
MTAHLDLVVLDEDLPVINQIRGPATFVEVPNPQYYSLWNCIRRAWYAFWDITPEDSEPKRYRLYPAVIVPFPPSLRVTLRDKTVAFWPTDQCNGLLGAPRKVDCSLYSSIGEYLMELKGAIWTTVDRDIYTVTYDYATWSLGTGG